MIYCGVLRPGKTTQSPNPAPRHPLPRPQQCVLWVATLEVWLPHGARRGLHFCCRFPFLPLPHRCLSRLDGGILNVVGQIFSFFAWLDSAMFFKGREPGYFVLGPWEYCYTVGDCLVAWVGAVLCHLPAEPQKTSQPGLVP